MFSFILHCTCDFEKHEFQEKVFSKKHDFEEKINIFKKHDFEETIFLEAWFWTKKFFVKSMILNSKFYYESDYELKKIKGVRFWFKKFTTRQIFYQHFKHASDFNLNIWQRVRFWVYFFCSLANFHAFIITCHVSVMFWGIVWVRLVNLFVGIGYVYPNCDQRNKT